MRKERIEERGGKRERLPVARDPRPRERFSWRTGVRVYAIMSRCRFFLAFLLLVNARAQNAVADKVLDCAVRSAALEYATHLQPFRNLAESTQVYDALQLGPYCGVPPPLASPVASLASRAAARAAPSMPTYYCNAASGSDAGPGTEAAPFLTVERGVAACRLHSGGCVVFLRDAAPFHLSAPLALDGRDSFLTLAAYPGEAPVLSGGVPLAGLTWTRVPGLPAAANVWRARAPLPVVPGALLSASKRLPRARWPNGDADTDTVPRGYGSALAWEPRAPPPSPPTIVPGNFTRAYDHYFPAFVWARGGAAAGSFEPPEGFWINPSPAGGSPWRVPGAFLFSPQAFSPRVGAWSRLGSAVVHCFHGAYWGGWQFRVEGVSMVNASCGRVELGEGGWQEARGWPTGGALYVENILEELDSPGEWYYEEGSQEVTLWHNATPGTPPPTSGPGVPLASALEVLVNATGTPGAPLVNLTLVGLTLTATQPTFLTRRFRAPSGGDWSFSEAAAVLLSHTQGALLSNCTLVNLGGNGVYVYGANVGAQVRGCSFSRLGESGVVACGERGILQDLRGWGVPEGTVVADSLFSELGVFVKQSGAFYAALAANSTVARNIAYNLPRAAVNVNDGAHGGHVLEENLFFQTVRETQDHGSVNTWERQPYLRGFSPDGTPLLRGSVSHARGNFLICDGYAIHCLDQ